MSSRDAGDPKQTRVPGAQVQITRAGAPPKVEVGPAEGVLSTESDLTPDANTHRPASSQAF